MRFEPLSGLLKPLRNLQSGHSHGSPVAAFLAVLFGSILEVALIGLAGGQSEDTLVLLIEWMIAALCLLPLSILHGVFIATRWPRFVFFGTWVIGVLTITTVSLLFWGHQLDGGLDPLDWLLSLHWGVLYGSLYTAFFWVLMILTSPSPATLMPKGRAIFAGIGVCFGILFIWSFIALWFYSSFL